MSFPANTALNELQAKTQLINAAVAAGIPEPGNLAPIDLLATLVSNLLSDSPAALNMVTTGPVTGGTLNIGASGAAASDRQLTKTVTGLADTVATDVLTITVPNVKANAVVRVTLLGSLGAGGAIGAGEAAMSISYDFAIVRTAGVNATGLISTAFGSCTNKVAGASTITVAGALSSVTGAVGAVNTFTVTAAITKGSGSSDNHVCVVRAEVLNAFASGISVA